MNLRKTIAIVSAAALMLTSTAVTVSAEESYDSISRKPFTVPDTEKTRLYVQDGRMFSVDVGRSAPFTGKTKNSKGSRYYVNGSLYFGWQKLAGKWYYFDPDNDGYMAQGKAKTAAGTYALDADGSWNGGVSKSGKVPEVFFLTCTEKDIAAGDLFELHISSPKDRRHSHITMLSNEPSIEENSDIVIPAKDRQIIYDMLLSCKVNEIQGKLDSDALDDMIAFYNGATDNNLLDLTFCIDPDGKEQTVSCSSKMYDYYDESGDVQHMAYFVAFMDGYITNEIPKLIPEPAAEPEKTAGKQEKNPDTAEVTKTFKNTDSRIYKTSGEGFKTSALLTSEEEAWDFTQDILAPVYGKNRKFITFLVNYEQEFFEDHVIYVETYSGTSDMQFRFERAEKVAADGEKDDIRMVYTSAAGEGEKENVDFVLITILDRDETGRFGNAYNYYI